MKITNQVKKTLTPPKHFFEWCESQIPTYVWENKKETILASLRKNCPIIKKRLTSNSKLTLPLKFYSFGIILVTKKRIEIQTHCYWQKIENGEEILEYDKANLERFSKDRHMKANHIRNEWYEGLLSNYGCMSSAYTNTIFYPNDWVEKLRTISEIKYVHLAHIEREQIQQVYKYRKEIEYLQKIGATQLASQIILNIYGKENFGSALVDMRVITKKWLKSNKFLLKTTNPSFNEIMLKNYLKSKKVPYVKGIEKVIHYSQIKKLPKEIRLKPFQEWFIESKRNFQCYLDYINMLKELKKPLTDHKIIFPTHLLEAHDKALEEVNMLKKEANEQKYHKRKQELQKFEKEIGDFLILYPKTLQEIIREGSYLHHCVGSDFYLKAHLSGDTNILFLRKKEDPDVPYFTIEYKSQKVVQIQGKYNREHVPEDVKKVIEKWQEKIGA